MIKNILERSFDNITRRGGAPTLTVKGHNKAITALAADAAAGLLVSGSYDGSVLRRPPEALSLSLALSI